MSSAGAADGALRKASASRTESPPRPTSTITPTMRLTIFQRKCDPSTRTRTSAPASSTCTRSILTCVDPARSSASA